MRLVIVNGVECEPYISCDDMLMRVAPRDVLAGALALVELAGAEQGVVVVEEDKPEALAALQRTLPMLDTQQQLTVVTVPTRYPAGGERQLIEALTGHEVPSLAKPTDIGYLCQNVGTAAALFRYLESGRPVTSRVTTVTGGAIATPRNMATILPISRKCTVRAASCRAACMRCSISSRCARLPDLLKVLNPIHRLGKSTRMVSCSAETRMAAPFRLACTSPTISRGSWSDLTSVILREREPSAHH